MLTVLDEVKERAIVLSLHRCIYYTLVVTPLNHIPLGLVALRRSTLQPQNPHNGGWCFLRDLILSAVLASQDYKYTNN